jgi:hypothetical protein
VIESNAYDNNLSMENQELSILSVKPKNPLVYKASSLSGSPRKSIQPKVGQIYNIHQKEYDYSIITKDSKRILNKNHNYALRLPKRESLNKRIKASKSILPELKYIIV